MNSLEKAKWNKYANDYIRKVEAFCQREIYKKFKLGSVKLDWSINRRSSRGGMYADGPGINIAMRGCCRDHKGQIYRVYEYSSFNDDPDIGGFYTVEVMINWTWLFCMRLLMHFNIIPTRLTVTGVNHMGPYGRIFTHAFVTHFSTILLRISMIWLMSTSASKMRSLVLRETP